MQSVDSERTRWVACKCIYTWLASIQLPLVVCEESEDQEIPYLQRKMVFVDALQFTKIPTAIERIQSVMLRAYMGIIVNESCR